MNGMGVLLCIVASKEVLDKIKAKSYSRELTHFKHLCSPDRLCVLVLLFWNSFLNEILICCHFLIDNFQLCEIC